MVTIIIPNYNGYNFLSDCLEALMPQVNDRVQVLVVDNGSTDQSVEFLKNYKGIKTCFLPENTGFCGAVNAGILASDTKYVILLNNDTKVLPGYVDALIDAMEQDEHIFSGSARMLMMHAPDNIDDAGDEYCALGWAFARGKGKSASLYEEATEVFAACGGASIYRRAVFDQIGLFDDHHFAYLEDIDIGYRARIYGYRNVYVPEAKVLHFGSGFSGSRHNAFKVKLSSRNSVYLPWKNMPLLQLVLNIPFLVLGYLVKYLFFIKKGLGKEYRKGLAEGIKLCRKPECKDHKVGGFFKHFKSYCHIQLLLWKNLFRLEH
jgi:GT2 family glycosyltransferase